MQRNRERPREASSTNVSNLYSQGCFLRYFGVKRWVLFVAQIKFLFGTFAPINLWANYFIMNEISFTHPAMKPN